ncbi:hypothetical protein LVJ94_34965 [Pendulispora rubella]|uniref:Uncharacterized protein n=1 Tax=Pendulispora rubella TaxID=2741070 RepID=A0ABZ2KTZ8_9BACT
MSFLGGGFGMATGPASGLRFATTRGRIQGSPAQGVHYPSPFFDVGHTYLPVTVKQLFKWCRYYFLTNPLINAVVFKLSEYPITDVIIDHDSPGARKQWTDFLLDHLGFRAFQVECGLDYHAYGNAIISLSFPFQKILYCVHCDFREQASKIRSHWTFTNYSFRLTCPRCHQIADARPHDFYLKHPSGIKLVRWNPEDVEISYNDITGEYTYYYTIPAVIRNDVVVGRKDVVESIPQVFVQAMREQKGIIFSKDNIFHLRRPTLATQDRGWGIPLLLPVLKDTYHLQLMKKAQESILLEHIVPFRVLFPQAGSGTADPYTTINLVDWRDHVATEIARWRLDNNYIPILPLPIGQETIGGDGRALLLTGEIQQWSEHIMVGQGVPREFLLGGLSYAGTNVSMRMLENAFLGYILKQKKLLRFIIQQVSAYLGWPEARGRFRPFRMADDLQRMAFNFQLNQAQKLSDTTLLATCDYNQEDENAIMLREADVRAEAQKKQQLALAAIQGEAQVVMMKYQAKAQQTLAEAQAAPTAPGEPGSPVAEDGAAIGTAQDLATGAAAPTLESAPTAQRGPVPADFLASVGSQLASNQRMPVTTQGEVTTLNVDLPTYAAAQARFLAPLPPSQQEAALSNLRLQSPELADMVAQNLRSATNGNAVSSGVDMRPLPDQRPPRRNAALV